MPCPEVSSRIGKSAIRIVRRLNKCKQARKYSLTIWITSFVSYDVSLTCSLSSLCTAVSSSLPICRSRCMRSAFVLRKNSLTSLVPLICHCTPAASPACTSTTGYPAGCWVKDVVVVVSPHLSLSPPITTIPGPGTVTLVPDTTAKREK